MVIIFIFKLCSCVFSFQDSTSSADAEVTPRDVQTLVRDSTLILNEPLEAMAGPLRAYRKRLQVDLKPTGSVLYLQKRLYMA